MTDLQSLLSRLEGLERAATKDWIAAREVCGHVYPHRMSPRDPQLPGWTADMPVLIRPGESSVVIYGNDWEHGRANARGVSDYIPHDLALIPALRNSAPLLLKLARLAVEARNEVYCANWAFGDQPNWAKDWLARYDAIEKEAPDEARG